MKIYEEKQEEKKSWSIRLGANLVDAPVLFAVDSNTGEEIAGLFVFWKDGGVVKPMGVFETLKSSGYDPYEHNNRFNDDGSLEID